MRRGATRRQVLAALSASTAALAGCTGDAGDDTGDDGDGNTDGDGDEGAGTSAATSAATTSTTTARTTRTTTGQGNRFTDGFERRSLGEDYRLVDRGGTVELTDEVAAEGDRSLRLSTGGARSSVLVRSEPTFTGEYAASVAVNRVADEGGATTLSVALVDPVSGGTTWPQLSLDLTEYARTPGTPVLSEFDEESRVLYNRAVGRPVEVGTWTRLALRVEPGAVTVGVGGRRRRLSTELDWTARESHLDFEVLDSGEADGITGAFDAVAVGPADGSGG